MHCFLTGHLGVLLLEQDGLTFLGLLEQLLCFLRGARRTGRGGGEQLFLLFEQEGAFIFLTGFLLVSKSPEAENCSSSRLAAAEFLSLLEPPSLSHPAELGRPPLTALVLTIILL